MKPTQAEMLERLADVWREAPNLRLGQLLVNAMTTIRGDFSTKRLFYVLDEDLVERLEEFSFRFLEGSHSESGK